MAFRSCLRLGLPLLAFVFTSFAHKECSVPDSCASMPHSATKRKVGDALLQVATARNMMETVHEEDISDRAMLPHGWAHTPKKAEYQTTMTDHALICNELCHFGWSTCRTWWTEAPPYPRSCYREGDLQKLVADCASPCAGTTMRFDNPSPNFRVNCEYPGSCASSLFLFHWDRDGPKSVDYIWVHSNRATTDTEFRFIAESSVKDGEPVQVKRIDCHGGMCADTMFNFMGAPNAVWKIFCDPWDGCGQDCRIKTAYNSSSLGYKIVGCDTVATIWNEEYWQSD